MAPAGGGDEPACSTLGTPGGASGAPGEPPAPPPTGGRTRHLHQPVRRERPLRAARHLSGRADLRDPRDPQRPADASGLDGGWDGLAVAVAVATAGPPPQAA